MYTKASRILPSFTFMGYVKQGVSVWQISNQVQGKFHIENASDICWDDAAFESLVLEQRFKDLLLSVVDSQIHKGAYFDDFIKGKGNKTCNMMPIDFFTHIALRSGNEYVAYRTNRGWQDPYE